MATCGSPTRAHLPRALHVDHQHHIVAALEAAGGVAGVRAVEIAEHVGVLEKFAVRDHLLEAARG